MTENKVAVRYAKALLLFTQEANKTNEVVKDFEFILELLNKSAELNSFVMNPIIRPVKKIKVFKELFTGKISEITIGFLILLVNKNRESSLKLLIKSLIEQNNELNNRIHVNIISGQLLSDQIRFSITEKLHNWTGKEILPTFKVDEKIIGGFQVWFAEFFYDASIRKHLDNLLIEISK